MRLTEPTEIESLSFAERLKRHDPAAWDLVEMAYKSYVGGWIADQLIARQLPPNAVEAILAGTMEQARHKIQHFYFSGRGSVWRWLCEAVARDAINTYLDPQTPEFVMLLKKQDETAWKRLIDLYSASFFRMARSSLLTKSMDGDLAHDALQDLWERSRRAIEGFEFLPSNPAGLQYWLKVILKSIISDAQRKTRFLKYIELNDETQEHAPTNRESIEAEIEQKERRDAYYEAVFEIMDEAGSVIERDIIGLIFTKFMKPAQIIQQVPNARTVDIYELTRRVKKRLAVQLKDFSFGEKDSVDETIDLEAYRAYLARKAQKGGKA